MPANTKSLEITERYRAGMIRLRKQGQREAGRMWRQVRPDDLDGTFPLGQLELTVSTLQREAARLSSAYLATFIASELGEPERPPPLSVWEKTFGGNPLREGLRSAVIKAKQAIKDGTDPTEATKAARKVLVSDVGLFIDTAARESLRQGMEMDDRIVGYQRALKGTCGACSGSTSYEAFSENAPVVPLQVHPNCQCVAEPVVTSKPSEKVKAKTTNAQLQTETQQVTEAIGKVHTYPNGTAPLSIRYKANMGPASGNFDVQRQVISLAKREPTRPTFTDSMLHELGHKLDNALAQKGGTWFTEGAAAPRGAPIPGMPDYSDLHRIFDAIQESKAYRNLLRFESGTEYGEYLRHPQEMFARAYAQWIGKKTGLKTKWTEDEIGWGYQWSATDFRKISAAFDNMVKKRGLKP